MSSAGIGRGLSLLGQFGMQYFQNKSQEERSLELKRLAADVERQREEWKASNEPAKYETYADTQDGKRGQRTVKSFYDPATRRRIEEQVGFAPDKAEPPVTRNVIMGGMEATQQWNPQSGTFETIGQPGPRWQPNVGGGGGQPVDKAANYQIVQGADGTNFRVNKLTGEVSPLTTGEGGAVVGANSFRAQKMAREAPMAAAQVTESTAQLDRLEKAANELVNAPGLKRITGMWSSLPSVPGGDAANAQAQLDTLKSQTGFNVLQQMRNMSKTGGALGAVSDKENEMLQNNLASLGNAQSEKQMRESLKGIIEYTQGAKRRLGTAYDQTYGKDAGAPLLESAQQIAAPKPAAGAVPPSAAAALRANPNLRAQFDAKYGPGTAASILGN